LVLVYTTCVKIVYLNLTLRFEEIVTKITLPLIKQIEFVD